MLTINWFESITNLKILLVYPFGSVTPKLQICNQESLTHIFFKAKGKIEDRHTNFWFYCIRQKLIILFRDPLPLSKY